MNSGLKTSNCPNCHSTRKTNESSFSFWRALVVRSVAIALSFLRLAFEHVAKFVFPLASTGAWFVSPLNPC
jgi:hypothetical protein